MSLINLIMVTGSLLLTILTLFSTSLMLYAWEDEEKHSKNRSPLNYAAPQLSFTVLLPARHEEEVIQETIQRVVELNYPRSLVEILIVIEAGDIGTIAKVNEKLLALAQANIDNVRLITFTEKPINKPHGLNIGLSRSFNNIVTIFDAEDEPHRDILQVINTVMCQEKVPVVQCGVQLMNYADRWFSGLNVLEYFFWFKSRLHFHSSIGMVPLGGNTIFIARPLLEQMHGWDQQCLTEDAELGIRLSAAGVPIRVLYDDEFVTKEETPSTVWQFIKQRTRWNQGFLQVLAKRDWLRLPTLTQRLLALYTLSTPLIQGLLMLYLPVSLVLLFLIRVPAPVAMVSSLPLYMVITQLFINLTGLVAFTRVHHLKLRLRPICMLVISFLPFQWMLSFAALRAIWRQIQGLNTWEKTKHVGAHRSVPFAAVKIQHNDKLI